MLANDLTLNPGSYGGTAADLVFVLGGYPTSTSSLRRVTATALTEPNSLLISHQTVKRGDITYNRHLVRRDRVLIDTLKGNVKGSAWLTLEAPNGVTVWTPAVLKDLVGHLVSTYMGSGVMDKILAGES